MLHHLPGCISACRVSSIMQRWHTIAARSAVTRQLLASFLQQQQLRHLAVHFDAWRRYLKLRVAKRMNALSALLHWEQGLLCKGLTVWVQRTLVWRWR
jgi:hypothetical protein